MQANEVERTSDPLDQASAQEDAFRAAALRAVSAATHRETHPDFDGESCIDCSGEIPEGRLKLGKIRCVDCQAALETFRKNRGM